MDLKKIALILVLSLISSHKIKAQDYDYDEEDIEKPVLSLNTYLPQQVLETLNSDVYISQFLSYMLTGSYAGNSSIDDRLDNFTLDTIFDFGLQLFLTAVEQDPPDDLPEIFNDLTRIKNTLRDEGTDKVYVKDLKPYLTLGNLKSGIGLYLYLNRKTFLERYKNYLLNEFLGGLDGACKAHSALWFDEITKGKLWAIQMFDSMAKLPPGLLDANINWVGSYKLCTEVFQAFNNTKIPPLKGKYCRAQIGFPISQFAGDLPIDDSIGLTYGMCVSQACDTKQVESIVSNSLKLMSIFKSAWVKNVECVQKEPMKPASIVYSVLLLCLIGWVVFSTLYDILDRVRDFFQNKNSEEPIELVSSKKDISGENVLTHKKKIVKKRTKLTQFLINCSLYSNTEKFFRTDNGGKITCLNGIRLYSMIWIIWGHTYNYVAERGKFFVLDNIRSLQELQEKPEAQLIINGMFGVDTFFLMSAFLLTTGFLRKLEKSKSLSPFEWAYYYVHRYWRLAPPFLITLVIYNWIMPYIGLGPLWNQNDFPSNNNDCHQYWWAYVLFINNFVPNGKGVSCMGYLWYIPNDYQFYAISPIFLIVLFKFPKAGKALLLFALTASLTILAFLTANVYVSRKKEIVQVLLDIWEDVYIKPYCRASPWIIGIFLGYIFFKNDRKIKLNYFVVAIGWSLSTFLALISIFGGYTNHAKNSRRMATVEYALYFSLSRVAWPVSISWIIFACHYGYGGIINNFLSFKTYIPFTRLSYCAYLIHPVLMVTYYFLQETLFHASTSTLIYIAIGHIIVTFFISFFYTLLFEFPFIALEKLVYSPKK